MRILRGWQAMRVVRKHTLPYHRSENLAEHTWGVMHILLSIWPECPAQMLKVAMYHDVGEYRSGDMPGDFKAAHPEVRDAAEAFEEMAAKDVLPDHLHDALSPTTQESLILKICDRIEFAFSCYHEWMLGNRYALSPMARTIKMAWQYLEDSASTAVEIPDHVRKNIWGLLDEARDLYRQASTSMGTHEEIRYASE